MRVLNAHLKRRQYLQALQYLGIAMLQHLQIIIKLLAIPLTIKRTISRYGRLPQKLDPRNLPFFISNIQTTHGKISVSAEIKYLEGLCPGALSRNLAGLHLIRRQ